MTFLALHILAAPALLLGALGLSSLMGRRLGERVIAWAIFATVWSGCAAAVAMLAFMLVGGSRHVAVELGNWVVLPHYHFAIRLVFDRLSVPFLILTFVLCGTIGGFATRYMHRESGYNRFFVHFAVFLLGMVTASLAGTIETLFAGWELVGLSSAFLIAFFHDRPAPVRNGLRVWSVYRISDAALLTAALLLHHMTGEGDFDRLMGAGPWPLGSASITSQQAFLIGLLLLVAAAGKSALVPFSGWLPRAMEGPTPSSAVFYGALSVHLGAYLLLRVSPILDLSPPLCVLIAILGLVTALVGSITERVQTDIKSALSYASLTQVGIIVAEIGVLPLLFGPWALYVPLVHMLGHACLRTLQFIRAPTILQDYRTLENAIGSRLPHPHGDRSRLIPDSVQTWAYRFALERGYLDAFLNDYVAHPFVRLFRWFDRLERRWTDLLAGGVSRKSDSVRPASLLDEL